MKRAFLFVSCISVVIMFSGCSENIVSSRHVPLEISGHILQDYYITNLTFDNSGALWAGTFGDGVIRYKDGKTIQYNASNSDLPDSVNIYDIIADYNDNIWIGTNSGLIQFNGETFHTYNTANSPLAEDLVLSVAVDYNNLLWIASCRFNQGGLMTFDRENWTLYTPDNSVLPGHGIFDIVVDSQNRKWMTVDGGSGKNSIVQATGNIFTIYNTDVTGNEISWLKNLAIGKRDHIFATLDYSLSSTSDMSRPNLIAFDGNAWQVNNPVDEHGESLGYVGDVATDLFGNVWVTLGGREDASLAMYNGNQWFYSQPGIPQYWGVDIVVDNQNTLWIGTGEGLYYIKQ